MMAFGMVVLVLGCGKGPKHIPKSDYQHGKAAFEMLQQYDQTLSDPFDKAAQPQIDAIDPKNINNGLMRVLVNYDISLNERAAASLEIKLGESTRRNIVLNAELGKRDTLAYIKQQADEASAAKKSYEDIQPIVKLCRDDAAQYFDASAASTNSCETELKAYRATHK
jgi:hypothetical protein